MRTSKLPDVLEIWGIRWVKEGKVWVGPAITDLEDPMLAAAVENQRIVRQDGRYVMEDPGLTLDRYVWHEGDITITDPGEEEP